MTEESIDFEYITKVREGDTASFRFFIVKYKDVLFTYAITILADRGLAEEAVQDAFVNAFRYLHTFRKKSSVKTWLIRIVINEANKKKRQIDPNVVLSGAFSDNLTCMEPLQEADDKIQLVRYALTRLDTDWSLALRLFYLEEYSIREIASIMNWGESKTKVTLHRARKALQKIVNNLQPPKGK
ncbi:RNA polymerase sigma factor [Chitinophaga sp. NPDC101104]|uniref:RNA polymerase sigma factor n=1 Tax=Chitinophaga sp. NPDC101104 TaxID=3390561 RepID=UPI003CFD0A81